MNSINGFSKLRKRFPPGSSSKLSTNVTKRRTSPRQSHPSGNAPKTVGCRRIIPARGTWGSITRRRCESLGSLYSEAHGSWEELIFFISSFYPTTIFYPTTSFSPTTVETNRYPANTKPNKDFFNAGEDEFSFEISDAQMLLKLVKAWWWYGVILNEFYFTVRSLYGTLPLSVSDEIFLKEYYCNPSKC